MNGCCLLHITPINHPCCQLNHNPPPKSATMDDASTSSRCPKSGLPYDVALPAQTGVVIYRQVLAITKQEAAVLICAHVEQSVFASQNPVSWLIGFKQLINSKGLRLFYVVITLFKSVIIS